MTRIRRLGQVFGTPHGLVRVRPPLESLPGPEEVKAALDAALDGIGAQGQPDFDEAVLTAGNPLPDDDIHALDDLVETHEPEEP